MGRRYVAAFSILAALCSGFAAVAQEEIKPPKRRIVGGEPTDINQHPWQVALQFKGNFFCGGSVVAQRWILTAAHCFKFSRSTSDWRVKAGATNFVKGGVWSEIDSVLVHEAYDADTHENDIAMIKLKVPAAGQVIPLAAASLIVPVGQSLEVTGWGATEEGSVSRELLKATVPHVDTSTCNTPGSYNGRVKVGMMCAGHKEGGIDSCQGDSGGPLVWRHSADGPILVGVVGWGDGCAAELKYGVYIRVAAYRDWIDRVIAAQGN
jgi:trypsin